MKEIKDELPGGINYFETRTRLKIRMAHPDDAAVIAKILTETFAEYKSLYTSDAFVVMTSSKDGNQKAFRRSRRNLGCRA